MKLTVLRVGSVDVNAVQAIESKLTAIFPGVSCIISSSAVPVPQEAYNSRRRQYNSTKILMKLQEYVEGLDADRILAVTNVDLFAAGLNFVFGEAECPGKVAVISFCRLRPEFHGGMPDRKLLNERCVKEAVHEVGHTLGLLHCRDPSCVMFFSNSILDTDRKGVSFCDRCFGLVVKRLEMF